jgi:hypothetical protein
MLKLGHPLGWDQSYKLDDKKQANFVESINIPMNKEDGALFYVDVIENLVLFSVINQEIERHLEGDKGNNDEKEKETFRDSLMRTL